MNSVNKTVPLLDISPNMISIINKIIKNCNFTNFFNGKVTKQLNILLLLSTLLTHLGKHFYDRSKKKNLMKRSNNGFNLLKLKKNF